MGRIGWVWVAVLAGFLAIDLGTVGIWRSEADLWAHAYRMAPHSPRAVVNHAKHLSVAGREAEAVRLIDGVRRR